MVVTMLTTTQAIAAITSEQHTATELYNLLIVDPIENLVTPEVLIRSGEVLRYVEEIFKDQLYPAIQELKRKPRSPSPIER